LARFFILTINYAPEPTGFAPKATALAEHLARREHDVHVFTGFPFAPDWRRRDEDRGRLFSARRIGTLTVHRLTHFIPRRPSSALQRIFMEGSFSVAAFAAIVVELLGGSGRPDAILYIGAQPALAMLARIVSGLTGRPYFVNITDLAAHAALDVGIVGDRLSRLLESFEFAAYRKAAGAGVLCQSFQDTLIEHGYPSSRIHLNRDPTDIELIRPVARDGTFRKRFDIPEEASVVLYAGSMGRKQGLMGVISAANLTRDANICWVLTGDGESHAELVEAVRQGGLERTVRFVPFQSEGDIAAMFADADMLLLNQISAVKDTVIPSKLLTYMAAGRPVLAAVNPSSQAAQLLRESDGGVLVAPDNPEALAEGARRLSATDPHTLAAFGARNRVYAEQHFDQRKIVVAHEEFMLNTMRARLTSKSTF
jgi:colanic acid biosynthesis glycosyl transferase WcaI